MKTQRFALAVLLVLVGLLPSPAAAQKVVAPDEAARHVGELVTVEGVVTQVSMSRSNTTFVNFGAPYPKQAFNAVIFSSSRGRFDDPSQWQGKRLRVTGKVRLYRGKPEIILERPNQVELSPQAEINQPS